MDKDAMPLVEAEVNRAPGLLARCTGQELRAETALLVVCDQQGEVATARSAWGIGPDVGRAMAFRRGEGFVGRLLESERPV